MILSKEEKDNWDLMVPDDHGLDSKPPVRVPNKHIIPADSILVNKELGTGEFGVVQQGVWTNEGERVSNRVLCGYIFGGRSCKRVYVFRVTDSSCD